MRTVLPSDCGNSPRTTLVGEFVGHWAGRDVASVAAWLAEDSTWTHVGRTVSTGTDAAEQMCPAREARELVVNSIVTHGRLASCDGYLESEEGRLGFSHVIRFASTSKNAAMKEIRTYLVEPAD